MRDLGECPVEGIDHSLCHVLQQVGFDHHFTGNNFIGGQVTEGVVDVIALGGFAAIGLDAGVYHEFVSHDSFCFVTPVVGEKFHSFDFYDTFHNC